MRTVTAVACDTDGGVGIVEEDLVFDEVEEFLVFLMCFE